MSNNRDMKYNYILYNMETADKWLIYKDLLNLDNVRMCKGAIPTNNPLLHKLHKLHWAAKLNSKINLPFKKLWFKKMTNGKFGNNKPTCFVLFGGQYGIRDPRLLDYMKKINPENKVAIHYRDLIEPNAKHIDMLKSKSDIIYTYNKSEVEKYGVEYFCSYIYSRCHEVTTPKEFKYDVYFVGYSKGRLDFLKDLCAHLTDNGVKCMFKIAGVPEENRSQQEGIVYLDKPIPYEQVVKEIQDTRCILELLQPGSDGATMRSIEAIAYKRKLLTNGKNISERDFYSDIQMHEIDEIENIDIEFLKSPLPYDEFLSVDYFSPERELIYLEDFFKDK